MITLYNSLVPLRLFRSSLFSFPRETTLLLYALSCFVLQLHLLCHNGLQMDLRKFPISVYDQTKINHLSRLFSININHNTNRMSIERKEKTGTAFSRENLNLIKTKHTRHSWNQLQAHNNGRKAIKKGAYKNPHRRIGTLEIGWLVHWNAAMAGDPWSRGFIAKTKHQRDKH